MFLSVPLTPYLPVPQGCYNRRMRMAVRRHWALLRAGFRPDRIDLPLYRFLFNLLPYISGYTFSSFAASV